MTGKIVIIGVIIVVAIVAIAFFAFQHLGGGISISSSQSTSTIPTVYNITVYTQGVLSLGDAESNGKFFPIPYVSSWEIPSGSRNMSISGSYASSNNTEAYILTPAQYGTFTKSDEKITGYVWYSGSTRGATLGGINMSAGNTYYFIFYSKSLWVDNVTIVNPIVVHYTH